MEREQDFAKKRYGKAGNQDGKRVSLVGNPHHGSLLSLAVMQSLGLADGEPIGQAICSKVLVQHLVDYLDHSFPSLENRKVYLVRNLKDVFVGDLLYSLILGGGPDECP